MQKLLWRELRGLLVLTVSLLLGLSLLSYHPGDPSLLTASSDDAVRNLVGRAGATLADALFQLFGISAYLLPLTGVIAGWRWFWSPASPLTPPRAAGWGLLAVSLMPVAAWLLPRLPLLVDHPMTDGTAGGWTGAVIAGWSDRYIGRVGGVVLFAALLLVSAMLITSTSLPTLLTALYQLPRRWAAARTQGLRLLRHSPAVGAWRAEANRRAQAVFHHQPEIVETQPPRPTRKAEQKTFEFMNASMSRYQLPPFTLLSEPSPNARKLGREELLVNSQLLEKRLSDFGIAGQITQVHPGPVITMYEFEPAPGVKLNRITNLSDDLALAMKVIRVRIVAPLPGKSTIGIEIPNSYREEVTLKEILASAAHETSRSKLTLAIGKDTIGNPVVTDLAAMPHLLIAGATGSGKSIALNTMVLSLLFAARPDEVKLVLIDPKLLEFSAYDGIPHLLAPVIVGPKEAASALQQVVTEMQRRYRLLAERGTRNIESYNKSLSAGGGADAAKASKTADAEAPDSEAETRPPGPLPYIVVIIDELADLMLVASHEVEDAIARLAQMARAAGIHLIVATQRPSVDVLTGVIKANFSARMSFQVSSKVDSRTVLDTNGAEQLVGKGDLLFMPPGSSSLVRLHGAYVSEQEVKAVVDFVKKQASPNYTLEITPAASAEAGDASERDALYAQAIDLVLSTGQASASFIQRRMRVGYPRAARMIEMMEEDGLVGPSAGSRPRQVIGRRPTSSPLSQSLE